MEALAFRHVEFTYPNTDKKALDDVSFAVRPSEFIVICGKSGCGKSTLLRHMKKNMMPYGDRQGEILYEGHDLAELDNRVSAAEIGFVQQNPENQIVTDKVWHELSFGLESLGISNQEIRRRVAEMASFFGIQSWFRRDVYELSGGQKQLLNLASIMAMQPKVLVLDEPTSQLDPIAATEFLETLAKINRELGTTIILSEHRLEEVFPMADRVMVMEEGKVTAFDTIDVVGRFLSGQGERHPLFLGLPAPMKIYAEVKPEGPCPVTVREGRLWLNGLLPGGAREREPAPPPPRPPRNPKDPPLLELTDVWFRYEKAGADILTIHVEADTAENTRKALEIIQGCGVTPAISIKPKTPAESVLPFLDLCGLILVMTVEPGFGGQSFLHSTMPKLHQLRQWIDEQNPACELEVDGGVNVETAKICRDNGANVLVAGSAYFKAADPAAFVRAVKA